jgi:hypothetical protein
MMKKGVLILLAMFLMVTTVEAKKSKNITNKFGVNYYSYNNAINFFEDGIEFFVFTNGDFDFDTNFINRRVKIDKDFQGRIRRIGNVRLRYDFRGNVTRIGNIRINYFRNRLTNVGDLRVRYDRWGTPIFYGNVRNFYYNDGVRFNVSFGDVCNYNDPYFFRNDFRRNYTQFREDRNFYYYKARPNAKTGKRSTIIKRRKQAVVRRNNNDISRRRSNNIYRKNKINERLSSHRNATNTQRNTSFKKDKIQRNSNLTNRSSDIKKRTIDRSNRKVKTERSTETKRRKYEFKKRSE